MIQNARSFRQQLVVFENDVSKYQKSTVRLEDFLFQTVVMYAENAKYLRHPIRFDSLFIIFGSLDRGRTPASRLGPVVPELPSQELYSLYSYILGQRPKTIPSQRDTKSFSSSSSISTRASKKKKLTETYYQNQSKHQLHRLIDKNDFILNLNAVLVPNEVQDPEGQNEDQYKFFHFAQARMKADQIIDRASIAILESEHKITALLENSEDDFDKDTVDSVVENNIQVDKQLKLIFGGWNWMKHHLEKEISISKDSVRSLCLTLNYCSYVFEPKMSQDLSLGISTFLNHLETSFSQPGLPFHLIGTPHHILFIEKLFSFLRKLKIVLSDAKYASYLAILDLIPSIDLDFLISLKPQEITFLAATLRTGGILAENYFDLKNIATHISVANEWNFFSDITSLMRKPSSINLKKYHINILQTYGFRELHAIRYSLDSDDLISILPGEVPQLEPSEVFEVGLCQPLQMFFGDPIIPETIRCEKCSVVTNHLQFSIGEQISFFPGTTDFFLK
jgi:hypothetical protein